MVGTKLMPINLQFKFWLSAEPLSPLGCYYPALKRKQILLCQILLIETAVPAAISAGRIITLPNRRLEPVRTATP
jgi:hypothetical protein